MIWETWNYNSYVENQLTLQLSIVQKYHLIHSTALQSLVQEQKHMNLSQFLSGFILEWCGLVD